MISEIMASGANQQQLETEVRICCVIQVSLLFCGHEFSKYA
jgi:hypothetical protein